MASEDDLLPPRKRNWTKGKFQLGVFVRTPDGGKLQMVCDRPTVEMVKHLARLFGWTPEAVDSIEESECFPKAAR